MRIRKRDGTVFEAPDDYILQDGESFTVPMHMMDSARRMVHSDVAQAVLETAHREYRDAIEQRWQSDRWQSKPTERAQPVRQTFDSPQAAVEAAHQQYRHDIENRWRR